MKNYEFIKSNIFPFLGAFAALVVLINFFKGMEITKFLSDNILGVIGVSIWLLILVTNYVMNRIIERKKKEENNKNISEIGNIESKLSGKIESIENKLSQLNNHVEQKVSELTDKNWEKTKAENFTQTKLSNDLKEIRSILKILVHKANISKEELVDYLTKDMKQNTIDDIEKIAKSISK